MIYRYRLWGKYFFYVRETTLLKKIIITFLIRSSFIKRLTLGGLKNGQTFTDTAGGDHKSPCYCAEWLRAHYAVGCRALTGTALSYLMKLCNSSQSASHSGLSQHLIKSVASIETSPQSGGEDSLQT